MRKLFFGLISGFVLILLITSPLSAADLTIFGSLLKHQVCEYLQISMPFPIIVFVVVFRDKWIPLLKKFGKSLPQWMTRDVG